MIELCRNMKKNKELYEKYHSRIAIQKKFPTENNFTHYYSFLSIKKYSSNAKNALELGCGAGTNLFFLAKRGIKITGVDISENAIISCIQSAKYLGIDKAKFVNSDISNFRSKLKYDLVICFEVLEHLPDDVRCINTIYEILNDKGTALISVPSKNSALFRTGFLANTEKIIGHLRRYNKNDIVSKIKKTKFKIIEVKLIEGPIRDIFFHIKPFGIFIKFFKGPLSVIVNSIDYLSTRLFGESRIIIVLQK